MSKTQCQQCKKPLSSDYLGRERHRCKGSSTSRAGDGIPEVAHGVELVDNEEEELVELEGKQSMSMQTMQQQDTVDAASVDSSVQVQTQVQAQMQAMMQGAVELGTNRGLKAGLDGQTTLLAGLADNLQQSVEQLNVLREKGHASAASVSKAWKEQKTVVGRVSDLQAQLRDSLVEVASTMARSRKANEEVKAGLKEQERAFVQSAAALAAASQSITDAQARSQRAAVLDDVDHWEDRLGLMGVKITPRPFLLKLTTHEPLVKRLLQGVGHEPNNNQYAIAAHAASLVNN